MRDALYEKYSDSIQFLSTPGKSPLISFQGTTESIIRNLFGEQENSMADDLDSSFSQLSIDEETEKIRILHAAARIIRNDVASIASKKDTYPSLEQMTDIEEVSSH